MIPPLKLPKEDGAWYLAVTCAACGWLAAWKLAWEPPVVAVGLLGLLASAQRLRRGRRLAEVDPGTARYERGLSLLFLLLPMAAAVALVLRVANPLWLLALGTPACLYAPFLLSGAERHAGARVLAVVALSAIAPAMYLAAGGPQGTTALLLWAVLGGYFVLGSLFVMARIRRGPFGVGALMLVRVLSASAVAVTFVAAGMHSEYWILAAPFALLWFRSHIAGPSKSAPDPRRIGRAEAGYSIVSAVLVMVGVWMI